ncbi:HAD family hydrolase [Streptomyces sp. NPDC002835]
MARLVVGGAMPAVVAVRRLLTRPRFRFGSSGAGGVLTVVFTGLPFFRGALRSLRGRSSPGTDSLVTAATLISLVLRESVVALTVLWLPDLGEFLQTLTLRRTRRAIEQLLTTGEERVWVVRDGGVEAEVALDEVRDARRAMTMLLIACPCAAGLATPTAISAAIGNGARRGTLIKGGTQLEGIGRVSAVVFDKTGTLTFGKPLVAGVVSLSDRFMADDVLSLAASGELHARHPLAQAIVAHTAQQHLHVPIHQACEVVLGMETTARLPARARA